MCLLKLTDQTFLTPKDVKSMFTRIGRKIKLYDLFRSSGFPSIQIGASYFVREDLFDEWVKKQMRRPKIKQ